MESLSHHLHRLLQTIAATAFIIITLLILKHWSNDIVFWVLGATSLASSATIVFFTPQAKSAKNIQILSSYAIALLVTLGIREIKFRLIEPYTQNYLDPFMLTLIMIFVAIFIALYIFTLLHIIHPPATGLALSMAVHGPGYEVFLLLMSLAILLIIIKSIFYRLLEDIST